MKITEISRELVYQCYTSRIDCKAYWDSHGKHIPWDGSQVIKYNILKKLDLYKVIRLLESDFHDPVEFHHLELYVDGERLTDVGEITCFRQLRTKVKLDCCVGAG